MPPRPGRSARRGGAGRAGGEAGGGPVFGCRPQTSKPDPTCHPAPTFPAFTGGSFVRAIGRSSIPTPPMNALLSLWLPILLSAVVVFVISSLVHMVFKWHASDYSGFANEDAVRAAIRAGNPVPGRYVVPFCKDLNSLGSGLVFFWLWP